MLWALLPLALASDVGVVEFFFSSEQINEGSGVHFVGVKRDNGSSGVVHCNVSTILNSTDVPDAVEGIDYELLTPSLTFADGDSDPKAVVLRILNDQRVEKLKQIRLGVRSLPEEANGRVVETTLWLKDDNDGGYIVLSSPSIIRMEERLLFEPAPANESCLLWLERTGGRTGRSQALIRWHRNGCNDSDWITEQATHQVDWGAVDGPVVWQDGESDRKCAVERWALRNYVNQRAAVLIYADGLEEMNEGFCGYVRANGTAQIRGGQLNFSILIRDAGKTGGGNLTCTKGDRCHIDLSSSIAIAFTTQTGIWTFLQDVEHGPDCLPCSIGTGASTYRGRSGRSRPLLQFSIEGSLMQSAEADLGYLLRDHTPGDKSVCMCRFGTPNNRTYQLATLSLQGPYADNSAGCYMSDEVCEVTLRAQGQSSRDHLRIMPSCKDVSLTPPGFAEGAVAVANDGVFRMDNEKMLQEDAGFYKLCWCRNSQRNCTRLEDFDVVAGSFVYAGPYTTPNRTLRLSETLQVELIGIDLTSSDRVMLLRRCGEDSPGALGLVEGRHFHFGVIDNIPAGDYRLCWCRGTQQCEEPSHFNVPFGYVTVKCRSNFAQIEDGRCVRCRILFETPVSTGSRSICHLDVGSFLIVVCWLCIGTLLFLALLSSLRCRLRSMRLEGTPRPVADISQTGRKLIITTCGYHNFMAFSVGYLSVIPITISGTGHPLLDGSHFFLRILNSRSFEVLDKSWQPVAFRADSSMGFLQVSWPRALIHSTLHGLKLPLLLQLLLLTGGSILCGRLLDPPAGQGALVVLAGSMLAVLILLCWRQFMRPPSPMRSNVEMYGRMISDRQTTRVTPKGPERGLAVQELLDLRDHFNSFVQDRNMYYMDANIIRPLTEPLKLSYAELVGPVSAQWFVSHWWGTAFRVYCEALSRHAKDFDSDWTRTTYWVCTFANNQHKIAEELGKSHEESSFYQALHRGSVKGTCMILDEQAMPLKRSWCLFELLQTIQLKHHRLFFQGLLFCTETGVVNVGKSTVEMSMQIGHRMASLSLEEADATSEEDKNMIHKLVIGEMESFDHIDDVLKQYIAEALSHCEIATHQKFAELYQRLGYEDSSPFRARSSRKDISSPANTVAAPSGVSL